MSMNRRVSLRLVVAGVVGIFGGETFCLLGPLRYQRLVHVTCHLALYAGIVLVCLAAVVNWTPGFDRSHRKDA